MIRKKKIKLIQLKPKQIKEIRKKYWLKQHKKCAILNMEIKYEDTTLDHKHKLKHQKPGPNGRGLCRGVLHYQANSLEGVILKKYKRYGLNKFISLPDFLKNMAEYLLNPPIPQIYIHPKERQQACILKKSDYNKIIKYYKLIHPRSRKLPEYPKSGIKIIKSGKRKGKRVYKARLTKKWEKLLKKVNDYV